ncbi:glycoside hydrolase family 3 protein [Nocardia sp. XZ_19_385]|uniref:glycoside hydrolase family 3 protein n=1 Tax=Nocardia sp. XZ_19_385 TaxID=2769488 RepID=UPI00188FEE47|nr:glycoside hydrolase family 3 protein [Nocardia sp. XZ_19_385]
MTDADLARLARATLLASFSGTAAPPWLLRELEQGLGGVTLFAINGNMPSAEELAGLTAQLRTVSDPIVTLDEEGGDVTRLTHATGSPYPGSAALGVVDDIELTRRVHRSIGAELAAAGVNLDFAPSADVNTAPDNPIIGTRSFGSDPELVARHVRAAVAGLLDAGVVACVKHFPGHGDTREDSHLDVPVLEADLELLERRELVPFRAAIAAGVRAIMTGHLSVPSIGGATPATLSRAVVTGLLREHLGYEGVVVTDALDMKGASGSIGIPEASVRALAAGADLLCLGPKEHRDSVQDIVSAIVNAVRTGRLPRERLAGAADRVAELGKWLGEPSAVQVDRGVGLVAARRAIQVKGVLPVSKTPFVVQLSAPGNIAVGPVPWGLVSAGNEVDAKSTDPSDLLTHAAGRSLIIVLRNAHRHREQRTLTTALLAARPDAIVVEMGLPVWQPPGAVYIATYGAAHANSQAAAELLGLTGNEDAYILA